MWLSLFLPLYTSRHLGSRRNCHSVSAFVCLLMGTTPTRLLSSHITPRIRSIWLCAKIIPRQSPAKGPSWLCVKRIGSAPDKVIVVTYLGRGSDLYEEAISLLEATKMWKRDARLVEQSKSGSLEVNFSLHASTLLV